MNVDYVMTCNVASCGPDSTLESVAMMMWDTDCGSIAVVDEARKPIGIITDRDIAMGSALNHKPLWEISTREVTNNRPLFTCTTRDDIGSALEIMQREKIRRLPVVDPSGALSGMLSVDDVVFFAGESTKGEKASAVSYDAAMSLLKAVCKHHDL